MDDSIVVENLSKSFIIGKFRKENQLREALVNYVKNIILRGNNNKEEIWALKDISFSVKRGEVVGIIGKNGAGKSTLLKILSKITYPTGGRIKVRGKVGSLLEVGTGFHDELTGRENVYLNGSILGMKKNEVKRKLDAIIAFAEVEKFMDTPIKHYSSGMRLRLGFSVAAHLDTDILFIDEVLSVGDVAFQKKCLNVVGDLHHSGRTVLFVSHNMPTVENLCPRVIWIDDGKVRQDGPSSDVISDYMSQYATVQQSSKADLDRVYEREGSGQIRYTRIEFLDMNGNPKSLIRSGDSLKIRLHYQVNEVVRNPNFNLSIYTERGLKVATFGNLFSGNDVQILSPGAGYADLNIQSLNIMPDRYFLNMCILDVAKKYIDELVHFMTIDVEISNYYKTGFGINKQFGVTFFPHEWGFYEEGMKSSLAHEGSAV